MYFYHKFIAMKLHLLDRSSKENTSISVKYHKYPYFLKVWHYHPELELISVFKSYGTRFIGDSIEKFGKGDLILIGKNLPHMLLNDDIYFEESSKLTAESIVVHFKDDFLGHTFFKTPEMNHISELFLRAKHGIQFIDVEKKIIEDIKQLIKETGFEKTMKFIRILNNLALHKNYKLLASDGYINTFHATENKNLDKIYAYIFNNFNEHISLETVANIANMNPSAFSRFFKRINRKSFSKYLSEIRIGYACKLLIENNYNITRICFESGYNNVSNFNRQFKAITNMSPSQYLQHHNNNLSKSK